VKLLSYCDSEGAKNGRAEDVKNDRSTETLDGSQPGRADFGFQPRSALLIKRQRSILMFANQVTWEMSAKVDLY
jgi:hypothetical protein